MFNKHVLTQALAAAGLMFAASAVQAQISVFTSLAAFNAAVFAPGTDTFDGFSITGATPSPLNRNAGSYSYTVESDGGFFFGAGTFANPALSTNTATDLMTFLNFGSGVSAFGGNFYPTDINGQFIAGDVTLVITDGSGASVTRTITGASQSGFLGFVSSSGSLQQVTLAAVQPAAGFAWPTVDNLVLAAVPEPETYALMLAGLGLIGFMARRRRAA